MILKTNTAEAMQIATTNNNAPNGAISSLSFPNTSKPTLLCKRYNGNVVSPKNLNIDLAFGLFNILVLPTLPAVVIRSNPVAKNKTGEIKKIPTEW